VLARFFVSQLSFRPDTRASNERQAYRAAAGDAGSATAIASIAATPGQVSVDKAFGAIDVSCRKTGHQSTELRVDSEVHPQFITLTLVPDEFARAEERERYVNERLARFDTEAAKASALLDKDCGAAPCVEQRKALEETKARRVALLRERVDKARIRAPVEALAR